MQELPYRHVSCPNRSTAPATSKITSNNSIQQSCWPNEVDIIKRSTHQRNDSIDKHRNRTDSLDKNKGRNNTREHTPTVSSQWTEISKIPGIQMKKGRVGMTGIFDLSVSSFIAEMKTADGTITRVTDSEIRDRIRTDKASLQ